MTVRHLGCRRGGPGLQAVHLCAGYIRSPEGESEFSLNGNRPQLQTGSRT
nr:hypothetical protein [uncultured bacterium]